MVFRFSSVQATYIQYWGILFSPKSEDKVM